MPLSCDPVDHSSHGRCWRFISVSDKVKLHHHNHTTDFRWIKHPIPLLLLLPVKLFCLLALGFSQVIIQVINSSLIQSNFELWWARISFKAKQIFPVVTTTMISPTPALHVEIEFQSINIVGRLLQMLLLHPLLSVTLDSIFMNNNILTAFTSSGVGASYCNST